MAGYPYSRREFLKTSSMASLALLVSRPGFTKNYVPKLSFSTLGCPDWNLDQIIYFAKENKYQGVEIRGIQRQLDLLKTNDFKDDTNIKASLQKFSKNSLKVVDLGSSANMHFKDPEQKQKNLDETKNFIRLAHQLECPYLRVFPEKFPAELSKQQAIEVISGNLHDAAVYAQNYGVTVLMETHGDVVHSDDILNIMQQTNHPNAGLVWDVINMWRLVKEPVADVYLKIKKYIRHVHVKDAGSDGKDVIVGSGVSPIFEAIDLLANDNFPGYFSFEWEKLWHPDLEEPEIALATYVPAMKKHFSSYNN
jgi:sugar phosphate isomerase/epimerase